MSARFAIPFVIVCGLLMAACSRPSHPADSALRRAEVLADWHYAEAAVCLDSIDRASLSAADCHFYDFLSLKVADKAYVQHKSDSTILRLIDYASHCGPAHYAEVLYYGGRVYSDLGDYPSALKYFQDALDALPDNDNTLLLRGNILSQTGRLLNNLRLYDQAAPYIEAVIDINRRMNDSINEVYNLQLLGYNYLSSEKYHKADSILHIALAKSIYLPEHHQAKTKVYLAGVKYRENELDSAISYINNTAYLVTPIERNTALGFACNIYMASNMLDSAYAAASTLIKSPNIKNHNIAYDALLSPELREYSHPDTLLKYIDDYSWLIENSFDENENEMAIAQQAFYNYQLHDRERNTAERKAYYLQISIAVVVFIAMLLAIIALWLKNRLKNKIIALHEALEAVSQLKQQRSGVEEKSARKEPVAPNNSKSLRKKLIEEILGFYQQDDGINPNSHAISDSGACAQLQSRIAAGQSISTEDPLWKNLESTIDDISPNFVKFIHTLTGGTFSQDDYHTLILIKFNCRTAEICQLLCRSENAILSRREKLSRRMFDCKLGSRKFDTIIRMM